jgi:glycosyltransferase involved in cell wall biosynthesis
MVCRKVADSQFSKKIQLVPYNAAEGLEEIYAEVDLVVLLSSYEGFGLPVLEAQGFGVPVLCSDLPVLQEVGGEGAVYVRRDDVSKVACAICRFIKEPDYYGKMRARALENMGRFSWRNAAEKTLDIYRNA